MHLQRVKYKEKEQMPFLRVQQFKQEFEGGAPAPFIGRFGYPRVNIGILSPQKEGAMEKYDSPHLWSARNFPVESIAHLRSGLVNSRTTAHVKEQSGRFLDIIQEVGMARKAVEVEVALQKPPVLASHPEREITPYGPGSEIKSARITQNSSIHPQVEKAVRDTDVKASRAVYSLYRKGFEENSLTKLISVGALGVHRKMVPTRWSITAVDDTLGKQLLQEIKEFPPGEYQAFWGGGWGNSYLFLFFPEVWGYELFETYLENPVNPWSKKGYAYSTDSEGYAGRKEYAQETAGGYYAARLPVLEKMKEQQHQHSCLALRFITSAYTVPLGVWVCREASRKSLLQPLRFASQELLLQYARELIQHQLGFDVQLLLSKSKLLQRKQLPLSSFL